ncbi:MAG TPA: endo-1,3-alpha-glucanase family glycosylhydrolase [Capsulimonadaceae bacterium]|jgi:hypothetical protein
MQTQRNLIHRLSSALAAASLFAAASIGSIKPAQAQALPDFRLPAKTFFEPSTRYKNDRKVFAWYMVCCGPFGGNVQPKPKLIAQYKAEIQMAQSMGIDGFGLDIMQANSDYHNAVEALFEAAKELNSGFQLFFECDYGNPKKTPSDYADLVRQYGKHANYFKVKGKPLVCAYGADTGGYGLKPAEPVSWWKDSNPYAAIEWWKENLIAPLKKDRIEVYFVPITWWQLVLGGGTVKSSQEEMAAWGDAAQGMSMWQIQNSPIGGGLPVLERQGIESHKAGKTWMTSIATHYWWGSYFSIGSWHWQPGEALKADNSNRNGKFFEHAGGQGLEAQWVSAMVTQNADWVMMLTWNDYNESYIEPIDDYKKYPNGTAQGAPLGWYKPQAGMDELNRYYTQWYKTGRTPKIIADSIFYSYITHSYKTVAAKDPRPAVSTGNTAPSDNLYVTTALTAPAKLRVDSGSTTATFDVPAGVTHTVTPFVAGAQTFSLWRDGKKINSVEGEPVLDKIDFYDYWPTTGYVETLPGDGKRGK